MNTLPIPLPPDFSVVVKKGDHVEKGDLLAKAQESSSQNSSSELIIDLVAVFNESANTVRKYLQKGPGDSIHDGDLIATRTRTLGLKSDSVVSHSNGTIVRFERDTGKLIIQSDKVTSPVTDASADILSPLAGNIKVCNNDSIVITPDEATDVPALKEASTASILPKVKAGEKGIGGKATGQLLVLSPDKGNTSILSSDLTKEAIGKILLLPDIEKEAVAKASAIGVAGILGTDLAADLFTYVESRKIDIPIISIEQDLGKKLMKSKNDITINGKDQTVTDES